jgi:PIN domain nuclease of toxin-antitoxin system
MTWLLDTHAFLWLISSPERIPARLVAELAAPETELLVSAASAMEIATKVRIGKLPEAAALVEPARWARDLKRIGARVAPLTGEQCLLGGSLAWANRDPFDRLIAAQALDLALPLATRDPAFADIVGLDRRWA